MPQVLDLKGTSNPSLQIEKGGTRLKNTTGNLAVRNAGDTSDAELTASRLNASGDEIVINSDAVASGNDWKLTLRRALTGMAANLLFIWPSSYGSPGQVLSTDGSGTLSFTSVGGSTDKLAADTTTLAFNSAATVTAFTLPANAIVYEVDVIIDASFNGTPSMSVGISGSTSKYLGANQVDLADAAGNKWIATANNAPVGTTENIIITYSAGGATAGSARVLVYYSIPA